MNYYILGVIFGIITSLTICFIAWAIHRKRNPDSGKYDERQAIGRGKAFQAGFYTLLVSVSAVNIWEYIEGSLPGESFLWQIGALLLGITVFALTAIHYDAYVGMYDKPMRFVKIGVLFVIAMSLSGIVNLSRGREESYVMAVLNLAIAILWIVIIAALLIHQRFRTTEDTEE